MYYFKHSDLKKVTLIDFNLIKTQTAQLSLAGSGVCVFSWYSCPLVSSNGARALYWSNGADALVA